MKRGENRDRNMVDSGTELQLQRQELQDNGSVIAIVPDSEGALLVDAA